jgi:hypothetical protein
MCRQFLDTYGTLSIVLHLDRKPRCKKHKPIFKSEIRGTVVFFLTGTHRPYDSEMEDSPMFVLNSGDAPNEKTLKMLVPSWIIFK